MNDIQSVLYHPVTINVAEFFITVLGSLIMYLIAEGKNFPGIQIKIKQLYPSMSDEKVSRLDFIFMVFVGAFIGTIFFQPHNPITALAAGLGWVGALNMFTSTSQTGA